VKPSNLVVDLNLRCDVDAHNSIKVNFFGTERSTRRVDFIYTQLDRIRNATLVNEKEYKQHDAHSL
jgi:hypothetical protein